MIHIHMHEKTAQGRSQSQRARRFKWRFAQYRVAGRKLLEELDSGD